VVVIEVRNAELMETVANEAERLDIANGAIVSLIGAVDSFTISTMPKHDATKDVITDYYAALCWATVHRLPIRRAAPVAGTRPPSAGSIARL